MQTKLHRWATADDGCRFDDLFNLVGDPGFLTVAWNRVARNKGARSAGVDGQTVASVTHAVGVEAFLAEVRSELKAGTFVPSPVREKMIPKANGKLRRLGIPTVKDRLVQAALKLVLEPIFEAGFQPCSYGFRPKRRPHDAVAEVHFLASRSYEWALDCDVEACFDNISHPFLMSRVRRRVGDKRVLSLIKAFLKSGILTELGMEEDTYTGTPQGALCSAEHKPPNEQCWVMRSVGLSGLVRALLGGRALRITFSVVVAHSLASQVSSPGSWFHSGSSSVMMSV